jgi:hypothetical protein
MIQKTNFYTPKHEFLERKSKPQPLTQAPPFIPRASHYWSDSIAISVVCVVYDWMDGDELREESSPKKGSLVFMKIPLNAYIFNFIRKLK